MSAATFECSKCHVEMFEGAHFCVRCGTPRERAEGAAAPASPATASPPTPVATSTATGLNAAVAEATSVAEAVSRALRDDALLEIDTNFGALTAPSKPPPTPSVTAPKQPVAREDESSRRRQSTMGEISRDEVLRRARNKQSLKRAGLAGIDLSGANLEGVDFARADLEGANLEHAKLRGAILKSANLRQAKLKGADLTEADLDKADLEGASLEGACLERAVLKRATLEGAQLAGARLDGANLAGAELSCATLDGASLKGVDLSYSELAEAEFEGADLSGANLTKACLDGAVLTRTVLSDCDARHATFRAAELGGALMHRIKLDGAIFTGARAEGALAEWIDLSVAGDGSLRKDGDHALRHLRGEPDPVPAATTRYFGKGDVLRDATLEFGENSVIHIDSRFENCSITLREGAELTIGDDGLLKNCSVVGNGKIIVHGRFFERSSPGIVGARSLLVSSRGGLVAGIEQAPDSTVFAFEPGCRLRVKILRPRLPQAAE
jgi:uncharacterized protein YjbI with pentapeptide repeats